MDVLRALEALVTSAGASHGRLVHDVRHLDGVGAARRPAPLDQPIALHEAVDDELLVLRQRFAVQQGHHLVVADRMVAVEFRALDAVDRGLVVDGHLDVTLEALLAEDVLAVDFRDVLLETGGSGSLRK